MTPRSLWIFAVCAICWAVFSTPALSQRFGEYEVQGTSYRVFARPGQNTIQVLVIGNGGQSGLYKIGEDTDLVRLIALAGGSAGAGRSKTTVRLYRPEEGARQLVFEAELDEFIGRESTNPELETGDVIQIETIQRRQFGWREVLQIITTAATLTFSIERLLD